MHHPAATTGRHAIFRQRDSMVVAPVVSMAVVESGGKGDVVGGLGADGRTGARGGGGRAWWRSRRSTCSCALMS